MNTTVTIDATGKALGRLATEVSVALQGKRSVHYTPHVDPKIHVRVIHCAAIKRSAKQEKIYYRSTGYPGNVKSDRQSDRFQKNPGELLTFCVSGMLPKNPRRKVLLSRLITRNT